LRVRRHRTNFTDDQWSPLLFGLQHGITVVDCCKDHDYPFAKDTPLIYLGEIVNMPGHCIIAGKSGKVYFGYHIENFRELTDDEV